MNIQDELINTIEMMVARHVESQQNMDVPCVVTAVNGDECSVYIDGNEYKARNGIGLSLKVGSGVWVHKMNGSMNHLYIMSKR